MMRQRSSSSSQFFLASSSIYATSMAVATHIPAVLCRTRIPLLSVVNLTHHHSTVPVSAFSGGRGNFGQSVFMQGQRLVSVELRRRFSGGRVSMSLKSGIVGLPNVGKSTLFNALLQQRRGVTAFPRGPSQFMNPETLGWRHVIHRPETPERRSSVRTNAGRNKKWRTLEKGRLEGNKRTRSNGKPKPATPGPGGSGPGPGPGPGAAGGVNEDGTERPVKEPRVKPKKGPKPKERVSWAGQEMLLLNPGDRSKIGKEVQPWASVRTERMPDDYYKYGPFGPHAWKGVTVGSPRRGTLLNQLVVFFSSVENEEEHELGDIQDAITGYAKRVDQMDEEVGVQYYFAFVRQVAKVPGLSPWEDWTLVSQVAVESAAELDKWSFGSKLDRRTWELLTRCAAWYRPDLIYVKRPAYQVRFEPQQAFLEGWLSLLDPENKQELYYERLCKLLGVDENENAEQVGVIFDGFSEEQKMKCVEHVLTSHPVCLLTPFTAQAFKAEQQQKGMKTESTQIDAIEDANDEDIEGGLFSEEDDPNEDESDEEFEPDMEAFNEEEFDFDESQNDWEREALAAEAMHDDSQTVDDEDWNEQSGIKGQPMAEEKTETEEVLDAPFLDAALRPFTYTNLIKEIFIIRRALVDLAELRR